MLKSFQQYIISRYKLFPLILLSVFQGCGTNPLDINVDNISIREIKFSRFEQDLFQINKGDFQKNNKMLLDKYGDFFTGFVVELIHIKGIEDSLFQSKINEFVTNPNVLELYNEAQKIYPTLTGYEDQLTLALKHYKYYFPEKKIPHFLSMISGLNYNIAPSDSSIGVSLEMYMGAKNKYYEMAEIPMYMRQKMNTYNLVPDIIKGVAMTDFPYESANSNLLSEMIYQGKILYFIDAMLPQIADTVKIAYTTTQWNWAERNESNVWGFLLKNKLLFTTANMDIAKYINDAPFTSGMVKESPGRIGCWLGWRIVKKYMKSHPDISLKELMNDNDAQKILNQSNYKP